MLPGVKIVTLLRDPVMRTFSHWKERRRNNLEELDFAAALRCRGRADRRRRAAPDRRSALLQLPARAALLRPAERVRTPRLERWYRHFPAERILVLASEDYYAHPADSLARAFAFLGLPPRGERLGRGYAMLPPATNSPTRSAPCWSSGSRRTMLGWQS